MAKLSLSFFGPPVLRLSSSLELTNHDLTSSSSSSAIATSKSLGIPNSVAHTMTLLRPSITGRLLRAAGPAAGRSMPVQARYESQTSTIPLTPANPSQTSESPLSKPSPVRHNQPDYTVQVDQAASLVGLSLWSNLLWLI
jgi:hypothetical protein